MDTTVLAAIDRNTVIVEAAIGAVIVILLIAILVMSRRRKKSAEPKAAAEVPNYYADLQQQPTGRPDPFGAFGSQPLAPAAVPVSGPAAAADVPGFAAVAGPGAAPSGSWSSGVVPPPADLAPMSQPAPAATFAPQAPAATFAPAPTPSPPTATPTPPAGTPAGWLPDPGGAPDTLRYWDGNAWTPHFAQRS